MRLSSFTQVQPLKNSKFWLLGIASGLIIIHLNLSWRSENIDLLTTSLIFWPAVSFLIWEKHEILKLESGVFSSCLGILLISWVLLKSASLVGVYGYDPFLNISPVITALGLVMLASGVKGLKQYWQEITLLGFLAIPSKLPLLLVDIPSLTAKFATYILWHLGFSVSRQGVNIILPTGSVEVYPGCAGIKIMFQLLGLALLFLVMFPTNLTKKVTTPVVAVFIAFTVNGLRVALMAVLANSNEAAFKYWHEGTGSLIFSMIAAVIFGLFCYFLLIQDESENQDARNV